MSNSGALSDYPNAYSSVADVERLEQERRDKVVGNPNDYLEQGDSQVSDQNANDADEASAPRDRSTTNEDGTLTDENSNDAAPIAGTNEISGDGEAHDGGSVQSTQSDHENPTGS